MNDTDRLEIPEHIVSKQVKEELVLLNIKDGTYYKLNPTALDLWEKLKEGLPFCEACDALCQKYEVNSERLKKDATVIVQNFLDEGLATVIS